MDNRHAEGPSVLKTEEQENASAFMQMGTNDERPDRLDLLLMGVKAIFLEKCKLAANETIQRLEERVKRLEDEVRRLASSTASQPVVLPGVLPVEVPAQPETIPEPIKETPTDPPEESHPVPMEPSPSIGQMDDFPVAVASEPKPKAKKPVKTTGDKPTRKRRPGRVPTGKSDKDSEWYKARKLWAQKNYMLRAKGLPEIPKPAILLEEPPKQEKAQETAATATASEGG
jgi:hypothetical protein